MKRILVPVANRPECVVALKVAFDFAKRVGGDVWGVHIRPNDEIPANLPADALLISAQEEGAWPAAGGKEAEKASRDAEGLFRELAQGAGFEVRKRPAADATPAAYWQERLGTPHFVMPIIGPVSDLVIVSRPKKKGGKKARIFVTEALSRAHRPVLILPQKGVRSFGRHVAIAWNRSGEAARAVANSLALIKAADKVTIISVGGVRRVGPSDQELASYLLHHGITAERRRVRGTESPKSLVEAYREEGADALVMGAYGRSRWSEMLFGGFTEYMLTDATMPVVMLHS